MNHRTIAKAVSLFAAAASFAFIASNAASVGAAHADVVPASACAVESDYIGDYVVSSSGIFNQSGYPGGRGREIHCPVSSSIREDRSGSILVDLFDGNNENHTYGRVLARACIQPYSGAAVDCSIQTELTANTETGNFGRYLDADDIAKLRSSTSSYATLKFYLPIWGLAKSGIYGFTAY